MEMNRLLVLLLLTFALSLPAKEIRVSLLDNPVALNDTAALLLKNGCSAESVMAFKLAVKFHALDRFDRGRFPAPTNGFYTFKSVAALGLANPDPFCERDKSNDMPHASLVCLDTVVLLLKDTGAKAPEVQKEFATKCFSKEVNRGTEEKPDRIQVAVTNYANPNYVERLMYPAGAYTLITGLYRSPAEEDLGISLKGARILPGEFKDTDEAIHRQFAAVNALRKRDGLVFPAKLKVVTTGYVAAKLHLWSTDHVAVCFEEGGRVVCVEKNGPYGPYMRVDFADEQEMAEYMACRLLPAARDPKENTYGAPVYVAVNDRLIHIARP